MKNTFYVLRRGSALDSKIYLGLKPVSGVMGPWKVKLSDAIRFSTIEAVVERLTSANLEFGAVRGCTGTDIVRVEEIQTGGGDTIRALVPLGTGDGVVVALRNRPGEARDFWDGTLKLTGERFTRDINKAKVFPTYEGAAWRLQELSAQEGKGVVFMPQFLGVQTGTAPVRVTYNEVVVA